MLVKPYTDKSQSTSGLSLTHLTSSQSIHDHAQKRIGESDMTLWNVKPHNCFLDRKNDDLTCGEVSRQFMLNEKCDILMTCFDQSDAIISI